MVDVLKILVPLRQGDSDEGKTILLNQCFANRNEEDKIYPLTVKQIVEAQEADSTLKQYFKAMLYQIMDQNFFLQKTTVAYAIKKVGSPYKVVQLCGITTIFSTLGMPVSKRQ